MMMDDLISRQQAYNLIMGQPPEVHYPSWYAEQIMQMRPAQKIEDLNKLTPLDKELKEAYRKGLNDAWETARKIAHCALWSAYRDETDAQSVCAQDVLDHYSASEAIKKLREYEQQKADEIKVGDEVEAYSGRAIVFGTFTDAKGNKFCKYWYPSDDSFNHNKAENLKKTGRHFPQVEELIKAIQGSEVTE